MMTELSEKPDKKPINISKLEKNYKTTELLKYLLKYLSNGDAESFFSIKQKNGENKTDFFNRIINEEPNKATEYKPNVILFLTKNDITKNTLKNKFKNINFNSKDNIDIMRIKINEDKESNKIVQQYIDNEHQDVILQFKAFINNNEEQKGKGIKKLNKQQKKNFLSKIFFLGSLKKVIIGIKKEKIKNILFKKIYIVINR